MKNIESYPGYEVSLDCSVKKHLSEKFNIRAEIRK